MKKLFFLVLCLTAISFAQIRNMNYTVTTTPSFPVTADSIHSFFHDSTHINYALGVHNFGVDTVFINLVQTDTTFSLPSGYTRPDMYFQVDSLGNVGCSIYTKHTTARIFYQIYQH